MTAPHTSVECEGFVASKQGRTSNNYAAAFSCPLLTLKTFSFEESEIMDGVIRHFKFYRWDSPIMFFPTTMIFFDNANCFCSLTLELKGMSLVETFIAVI